MIEKWNEREKEKHEINGVIILTTNSGLSFPQTIKMNITQINFNSLFDLKKKEMFVLKKKNKVENEIRKTALN